MPQAVVGMELVDLQTALGPAEPRFRARQIYDAVYRLRVTELGGISNLPKPLRARLATLANVIQATRLLTDPEGIAISPRRITLSTAGIVPKIEELGREPVRPKLAVSLNASSEEQRRALMPITRKYHLKDLMEACRAYPLRPWEKLTFEYVLLKGVNDTDADARRVVQMLAHLNAKVKLIALNPGQGIPFETPT